MDIQQLVLTANTRVALRIPGRFFMLVEAGGPLDIGFEKNGSPTGEVGRSVEAGYTRFPGDWRDQEDRFDGVFFDSPTNQTIRVGISQSAADYRRVVGVVQLELANDGDTADDQDVTDTDAEIAAQNTSRRAVHVQNTGDANIRVRLGGDAATATRGVQLQPGQSVTFHSTAAVHAIREGATSSTVSVTEETRA